MVVVLFACFLLSGFSSLLYETLWTRSLTHVIGGSPYAVSVILTVFMAGLGLGGALGGRLADRLAQGGGARRLLAAYGILEAGIGIYAMLLPFLLAALKPAFAGLYGSLYGHPLAYHAAVFLLASLPLLLPVLAMGATLPILGRFTARRPDRLGADLGLLYGVNTLGAALGVAAAGFWLLPALGLRGATGLAAGVNLLVGAAALILARRQSAEEVSATVPASAPADTAKAPKGRTPPKKPRAEAPVPEPVAPSLVLALFALSGFCAMAYEVVWTKVLSLIMGPTTYAFTWVLVCFIGGLALGGWAASRMADALRRPALALALIQVGAALFALFAAQRMGNGLFLFEKVDYLYHARFGTSQALKGLFTAFFMLPPTVLLGASFPLVMRLFARAGGRLGRGIGTAYAANTFGGVLGSWTAGFLLVPFLGSEKSLGLLAALQAATALAFGFLALRGGAASTASASSAASAPSPATSATKPRLALAALGVLAVLACTAWPRWDRHALGRAASRLLGPELEEASWSDAFWHARTLPASPLPESEVYYGDGIGGFTAVWRMEDLLGVPDYSLFVSGKADASSRRDMFTQVLLAHVPMVLHPDPKRVMVLGLASGVTAGEALRYPVDRVDVLEINPQVVAASDFFKPWNSDALRDPRARLILQDAKAHLLLSKEPYDVIISEPSNPWMAGLSELFSREFFRRAQDRLADGGVMVQFLHSYSMDWSVFSLVGRTFSEVFPNSMLVRTMPDDRRLPGSASDFLLVGRKGGAPLDFPGDAGASKALEALARSRNIRLSDPRLFSRLVDAENLPELFGPGPVHTDDKPILEFMAPRLRFTFDSRSIEAAIASGRKLRDTTARVAAALRADPAARLAYGDFALSLYKPFPGMLGAQDSGAGKDAFGDRIEEYCAGNHITDLDFLDDSSLRLRCSVTQMAVLNRRLKTMPGSGAPVFLAMGDLCLMNGILPNAARFLEKAVESSDESSVIGRESRMRLSQVASMLRSSGPAPEASTAPGPNPVNPAVPPAP